METFNNIVSVLANPMVGWALTALFGVLSVFFGAKLSKLSTVVKDVRDVADAYTHAQVEYKRMKSTGALDPQQKLERDADLDKIQKELVELAVDVAAFFKK